MILSKGLGRLGAPWAGAAALVLAVAGSAAAQRAERIQVSGADVAIYNLAGAATLEAGTGSAVEVEVLRGGADGSRLTVERGPIAGRETLRVIYPTDRVVYRPADGFRGSTTVRVRDDGTFNDGGRGRRSGGERVSIRSSGDGMDAFADLRIRVPRGQRLAVYLAVGRMDVTNVNGELRLDGGSSNVTTSSTSGQLLIDVGSGSVRVTGQHGDLDIDTGSGSAYVSEMDGGVLRVDTGSGSVSVRNAKSRSMSFDTGSGSVDASGLDADDVLVDTGSGSVDLGFVRSPTGLDVDTGSGGVTITLPADYTASVDLETSSGGIDLDFPVQITRWERDEVHGTIGSGAGRLKVDTGSGGIRIRKM